MSRKKSDKEKDGSAADGEMANWNFEIKSFKCHFTNIKETKAEPRYGASITVFDNPEGKTGNGEKHAVLKFYWRRKTVPGPGTPDATGLLHLNFSANEYPWILERLKEGGVMSCFYNYDQKYGGIEVPEAFRREESGG